MKTLLAALALAALAFSSAVLSGPSAAPHIEHRTITYGTFDNTTNDVFAITLVPGETIRVEARAIANGQPSFPGGSSYSASYGRIGSFRADANGLVSQIGAVASLGVAEQDSNYEFILDATDGQSVRLRAAGDNGPSAKWTFYVDVFHSQ